MKTTLLAGMLLATLSTAAANAATFTLYPNTCNKNEEGCTAIWVKGTIEPNDGGRFMELLLKDKPKKALVLLDSPGGNLTAALQIGRYIKANGFSTFVPSNSVCVSGCAMVWLAGNPKLVNETGKIRFHAAYTVEKIGKQAYAKESGAGNAVVGAYYAELGYSMEAIIFFTKAAPSSATWLTSETAASLGIKVKVISNEKKS